MGLFSSREDKIKKLNKEIDEFDNELAYKKALAALQYNADTESGVESANAYVLHRDITENTKKLDELRQAIEKLREQ